MKQRDKTKDTVIRREERFDGENRYLYELTVSESTSTSSFRLPLYSIRVSMTLADGGSTSAKAKEAFADAGKAILFYEKVVRNLATPIDLAYIMEDGI